MAFMHEITAITYCFSFSPVSYFCLQSNSHFWKAIGSLNTIRKCNKKDSSLLYKALRSWRFVFCSECSNIYETTKLWTDWWKQSNDCLSDVLVQGQKCRRVVGTFPLNFAEKASSRSSVIGASVLIRKTQNFFLLKKTENTFRGVHKNVTIIHRWNSELRDYFTLRKRTMTLK